MAGTANEPEPDSCQQAADTHQDAVPVSWRELLSAHRLSERTPVTAFAWIESFSNSYTRAVLLSCDDGNDYVVKGARTSGRTIVTDHILGQLGAKMRAPVGNIRRVFVPQELIDGNREEMGHIPAGLAHGSLYIPNCFNSIRLLHFDLPGNRPRFASVAVFYGWTHAEDRQFCYERLSRLVHSFDHGHFLPNGPLWDRGHLDAAPLPVPDPEIMIPCGINSAELDQAKAGLMNVDRDVIADAVASTPDGWGGVGADDMEGLAEFLFRRCEQLKV